MAAKKKAVKKRAVKKKAVKRKAVKKPPPPLHRVRAEARMLELANLGSGVNFRTFHKGGVLGRLMIGQGSLRWVPKGMVMRRVRPVPWRVFAEMMKEWPFGLRQKRCRLQFKRGHVFWSPRLTGPFKRYTWDEFYERMEMKLPKKKSRARKRA